MFYNIFIRGEGGRRNKKYPISLSTRCFSPLGARTGGNQKKELNGKKFNNNVSDIGEHTHEAPGSERTEKETEREREVMVMVS